jgi:hypothetical protein
MRKRVWWAVTKPYGVHALNTFERATNDSGGGNRADQLSAFATRAERDAYVEADPHHAEAVRRDNKHLRRALAASAAISVCPCCQGEPACAYCAGTGRID